MDKKLFSDVCEMSKIAFSVEEESNMTVILDEMLAITGILKQFTGSYDDMADNNSVTLSDLREDTLSEPFPTEKLMQNTEAIDNYYVVPKLMD